jgi:restriction system protein
MLPLLKLAGDGEVHRVRDVVDLISNYFQLSKELRRDALPDGRNRLTHRTEWARTYLKKAGLLEYPSRGCFKVTGRGLEVLRSAPSVLDNKFLSKFPEFREFKTRKHDEELEVASSEISSVDPEEAIDNSYQTLRSEIESDLLLRLKAASPTFFEQVVIDLLVSMGYGGSRKGAARAIGRSGDEGIDGVIDEDALGLDVVYVQAKRWNDKAVGRQDIQQFVGALQGKRARKGIFITTSTFRQSASDYVLTIANKVVLIDGQRLATLLFDHNVGVSDSRTYVVKKIDTDYFDE